MQTRGNAEMTSMTANLAPAQRRLMNVLYDTGTSCPGAEARRARKAAQCDHEDIVGLAMADLVEARRNNGDGPLVNIPAARHTLYFGGTLLRLTNLGISWCGRNPLNKLLRALDAAPRGRYDLTGRCASGDCDDDEMIVGIVTDGYATLHFGGDLRETKFQRNGAGGTRYEFKHGADYVLIPTPKIRTVLGPKA